MRDQTYEIVYLLTNAFNLTSIYWFMRSFFETKRTPTIVCISSYLFYFVATSAVYLIWDIPLLTLSLNAVALLLIILNYRSNDQKYMITLLFTLFFMMIPEILVGALTNYFRYSIWVRGSYSSAIGVVMMRLITYLIARIVYNVSTIRRNKNVSKIEWIAALSIPIVTSILEVMIAENNSVKQETVITSIILILFLNVFAFYLYDSLSRNYIKQAENNLLQRENELFSSQCEMMQNSTKELQGFRHNLRNQFIGVQQLLIEQKYEEVNRIVSELSGKMESNTLYSTTGNLPVDAIINYKLQSAIYDNIKVTADIAVPSDMKIEISDITVLLGNLIDNALQALQSVSKENKRFFIKVVYSHNRLLIKASNPFEETIVYENGEIVSSKKDKSNHGIGLKSIEKIVEKYDGYMEINHDDMIFTVDILIYLSKENA